MPRTPEQIDAIATDVMEASSADVCDCHVVAARAAETAASSSVDQSTRRIYRNVEAQWLLKAVFTMRRDLSAADQLRVAARIAERAASAR